MADKNLESVHCRITHEVISTRGNSHEGMNLVGQLDVTDIIDFMMD